MIGMRMFKNVNTRYKVHRILHPIRSFYHDRPILKVPRTRRQREDYAEWEAEWEADNAVEPNKARILSRYMRGLRWFGRLSLPFSEFVYQMAEVVDWYLEQTGGAS